MALKIGASHSKSIPCLVWCPRVFYRWRYNVFNMSSDVTWLLRWGIMGIFESELLDVSHHHGKSCDQSNCHSKDVMFFICHVTSRKHIFKGLYEFMCGSFS